MKDKKVQHDKVFFLWKQVSKRAKKGRAHTNTTPKNAGDNMTLDDITKRETERYVKMMCKPVVIFIYDGGDRKQTAISKEHEVTVPKDYKLPYCEQHQTIYERYKARGMAE